MAFSFAAFAYIIALICTAFSIFFAIWYVISIDELKSDYKNPIESCANLNDLVIPEYVVHALPHILFVFANEWTSIFICGIPLISYHAWRYSTRPAGMTRKGLFSPTTIMNSRNLKFSVYEGWFKLIFYLISFFYYLYSMIYVLISY
jgi:hypothetical protein